MSMTYEGPILEKLESSRKRPKVGDVFTLRIATKGYYLGRVIKASVRPDDLVKANNTTFFLVYIYSQCFPEVPPIDQDLQALRTAMRKENLLLPPFIETSAPWRLGTYKTIASVPVEQDECWEVHYFYDDIWRTHLNEYAEAVQAPPVGTLQPIGWSGMDNIPMLDLRIRKVLGIARPNWDKNRTPSPYANY